MRYRLLAAGVFVCALGAFLWSEQLPERVFARTLAESTSFTDDISAYRALMDTVGTDRAQAILSKILPNDSRTHTINHETGKFLYEHEGVDGIEDCTTAFAGGCYHGFLSAVIADRGIEGVAAVVDGCVTSLANEQTMQCAHGVGHGLLAELAGYTHLPEALDLCEEIFSEDHKSAVNCYDGVFMENNFGAFNVPPADRWYTPEDPMYPCDISAVLAKHGAHEYCWGMQSQMTLNAAAYPRFMGSVEKVGAYCDGLKEGDRAICVEGLGRQLQLAYGDSARIQSECGKLNDRATECIAYAASAAYIYGSRSSETLGTCARLPDGERSFCYDLFYRGLAIAYSATSTRLEACSRDIADTTYSLRCRVWMQSSEATEY